ncbi:MAG: response regulator [Chloroflexota bacterium]
MKKILVVEDSPTHRNLITMPLNRKGYRVSTVDNGEDALVLASQEKPDLIVLDVILPKKNGFQVCRQLKMSPMTKDIKVLMLTSKDQSSDRFWGLRQGADDYMTKPFKEAELVAAVSRLI